METIDVFKPEVTTEHLLNKIKGLFGNEKMMSDYSRLYNASLKMAEVMDALCLDINPILMSYGMNIGVEFTDINPEKQIISVRNSAILVHRIVPINSDVNKMLIIGSGDILDNDIDYTVNAVYGLITI